MDLFEQHDYAFKNSNQFRFTPPVHCILAFKQALVELEIEGGPSKRYDRYKMNHQIVREGLLAMGFRELVENENEQSKILNSFLYPSNCEKFVFEEFYKRLSNKGELLF